MICKYCGAEFEDNVLECPFAMEKIPSLLTGCIKTSWGSHRKDKNVKEETKKKKEGFPKGRKGFYYFRGSFSGRYCINAPCFRGQFGS